MEFFTKSQILQEEACEIQDCLESFEFILDAQSELHNLKNTLSRGKGKHPEVISLELQITHMQKYVKKTSNDENFMPPRDTYQNTGPRLQEAQADVPLFEARRMSMKYTNLMRMTSTFHFSLSQVKFRKMSKLLEDHCVLEKLILNERS